MTHQWTALGWEQEYDRCRAVNPHLNVAMDAAGDVFEALGDAQRRATAALLDGRVPYRGRLGFTARNLFEMWLWYAALTRMRPQPDLLAGARKHLRLQIKIYRLLLGQERTGIVGRLDGEAA